MPSASDWEFRPKKRRKIRLLDGLIARSNYPRKAEIIGLLRKIQNESKRNVFSHSYLSSDETTVTFVERVAGGPYVARTHVFTREEWIKHVGSFATTAGKLQAALGASDQALGAFLAAAISAANKSANRPSGPTLRRERWTPTKSDFISPILTPLAAVLRCVTEWTHASVTHKTRRDERGIPIDFARFYFMSEADAVAFGKRWFRRSLEGSPRACHLDCDRR